MLHAGIARTDITPPLGIAHAGWGAQKHQRATGVDLPLWATALALSDGQETVVIVDVDIIYIWETEAPAMMQAVADLTGLPITHIRVSYTHTHSGPINGAKWSSWVKAGSEMVPAYDEVLKHQIAGVAHAALQRLQPARICGGAGQSHIGVNRRFQRPEDGEVVVGHNWDGPFDPEVKVLRIDTAAGEPLAAIVNYACHPITVGPDSTMITPDYPGVVKRVVEQNTGATCLFLQGATGNIGPTRGVARNGEKEYKRLGAMLGNEASRVWWELQTSNVKEHYVATLESGAPLAIYEDEVLPAGSTTLRVATRSLHLPLKQMRPAEELEAEFATYNARLNELRTNGGSEAELLEMTMLAKRTGMRADLSRRSAGKTHRTFDVQIFTIGDSFALVALPGEPFAEIGMAIKAASPFKHTLFSGYSNIGWAYIPMPDAYPLGGYEVEITPFSPEAASIIIDESLALLRELAETATA